MTVLEPALLHYVIGGDGPTVGLAVHAGHEVRPDFMHLLSISESERLREEDPFTDVLAFACDRQILTRRSRFEVDLNRPPGEAICVVPEDCFGLRVWRHGAADALTSTVLAEHRSFYRRLEDELGAVERRHGRFVVFDIHSYNHRRDGPDAEPAPADGNPEINLGTGSMHRGYWASVVERFLSELRSATIRGSAPDVRENVKFRGREVARFVHERFPRTGCALAIEVKKTFMDEWTGALDVDHLFEIRDALAKAAAGAGEAAVAGSRP